MSFTKSLLVLAVSTGLVGDGFFCFGFRLQQTRSMKSRNLKSLDAFCPWRLAPPPTNCFGYDGTCPRSETLNGAERSYYVYQPIVKSSPRSSIHLMSNTGFNRNYDGSGGMNNGDETGDVDQRSDSLVLRASKTLTISSWISWWAQVVLTVVSSITFLFARSVMDAQARSPVEFSTVASKFVFPGAGTVFSVISIIWTWGGRRLARRFLHQTDVSRVQAAYLLRRFASVGITVNLLGLVMSLLGAQYIVGTLVAKAMQNVIGPNGGIGGLVSQPLQPLDVLLVQANTNALSSHFVSLVCLLWLNRVIDLLDPPSIDDKSRQ